MTAADHHIDLRRARLHRAADFHTQLQGRKDPPGNPVETAAMAIPVPASAATSPSRGTRRRPRSPGARAPAQASNIRRRTGARALAHRRETRPAVSSADSVVRSMRVTALSSRSRLPGFLTVRRREESPPGARPRTPPAPISHPTGASNSIPGLPTGAAATCGTAARSDTRRGKAIVGSEPVIELIRHPPRRTFP